MPVRSSNTRVLKWPSRAAVDAAARALAKRLAAAHLELVRFGYFGSYARGDWGVGSDLDLVAVVDESRRPFIERSLDFDTAGLPVPAELLVYTRAEWRALEEYGDRFAARLREETVWLHP
jgi:predicted nucleotidyltransferase